MLKILLLRQTFQFFLFSFCFVLKIELDKLFKIQYFGR